MLLQSLLRPVLTPLMRGMFDAPIASSAAWSPANLYLSGEVGVWYDPSDLSTMFNDSAGTTPVATPGTVADSANPVGLILDKSGGGHHASQSTSTARPLLSARVNLLVNTETLATQSVAVAAGAHTIQWTGAGTVAASGAYSGALTTGQTFTTTAGSLTLTVAGSVTLAQLESGPTATTYQRVNTASDYDGDPAKFPYYLKFDGVDDYLSTAAIDLTGTDKVTVFTGTLKAGTSTSILYETSTNALSGGAFFCAVDYHAGGVGDWLVSGSDGIAFATVADQPSHAVTTAEISSVFTNGVGALSVNVNGAPQTLENTHQPTSTSTGNFGNHPLFIGARSGPSTPFNGNLYSFILGATNYDAATVLAAETWVADKTGVTL